MAQEIGCENCPYWGITYSSFLQFRWVLKLWKQFACPKGVHLFDEFHLGHWENSPESLKRYDHCLVCDACDLMVAIAGICRYDQYEEALENEVFPIPASMMASEANKVEGETQEMRLLGEPDNG